MAKKVQQPATEVQQQKKQLEEEKKKMKADRKAAKKRAKEIAKQEGELDDGESGGGFLTFLTTVLIVGVWLAVIGVVIKLDVGGFGSNVMAPILQDIPVVRNILPTDVLTEVGIEDGTDVAALKAQIADLTQQLQVAQSTAGTDTDQITKLQAEVDRLKQFEDKQVEFERIQRSFYEEVVYADKGPGADAYRQYYEEMNPDLAESLYKQVVTEDEADAKVQDYVKTYSSMKPAQAAAIFESMTDDMNLIAQILSAMNADNRGAILGAMDAETAARVTKLLNPQT
jgi:flagellar motility protein MotE (MotC chaperone)